jgi:hypothetical protein
MSAVFIMACGDGSGPPDEPVAATLRLVSGDDQLQIPGVALADPIIVQAFDEGGDPVSGATVVWSVQAGEGTVAQSATTDNSGLASTAWTLGPEEGIQRVLVSCGSATSQFFQARAVEGPRDIAFSANPGLRCDLYQMGSDGGNTVKLTETSYQNETFPEWSPDGMKLAFVRGGVSVIDFEAMSEVQIIQYEDVFWEWGGLS